MFFSLEIVRMVLFKQTECQFWQTWSGCWNICEWDVGTTMILAKIYIKVTYMVEFGTPYTSPYPRFYEMILKFWTL